jgi:hypothetical protein
MVYKLVWEAGPETLIVQAVEAYPHAGVWDVARLYENAVVEGIVYD